MLTKLVRVHCICASVSPRSLTQRRREIAFWSPTRNQSNSVAASSIRQARRPAERACSSEPLRFDSWAHSELSLRRRRLGRVRLAAVAGVRASRLAGVPLGETSSRCRPAERATGRNWAAATKCAVRGGVVAFDASDECESAISHSSAIHLCLCLCLFLHERCTAASSRANSLVRVSPSRSRKGINNFYIISTALSSERTMERTSERIAVSLEDWRVGLCERANPRLSLASRCSLTHSLTHSLTRSLARATPIWKQRRLKITFVGARAARGRL